MVCTIHVSIYSTTDEFRFCCQLTSSMESRDVTCEPEGDEFSSCSDLMSNVALRVCIWILALAAVAGNSVVLVWRICYKREIKVH